MKQLLFRVYFSLFVMCLGIPVMASTSPKPQPIVEEVESSDNPDMILVLIENGIIVDIVVIKKA